MKSGFRGLVSKTKAPLAAGLVLLLLAVQALAASPFLHCGLHEDASAPDHICAVKTLAQGQVSLSTPGLSLRLPTVGYAAAVSLDGCPILTPLFFSVDSSRGPPSRA
jgi:hypothetical protein